MSPMRKLSFLALLLVGTALQTTGCTPEESESTAGAAGDNTPPPLTPWAKNIGRNIYGQVMDSGADGTLFMGGTFRGTADFGGGTLKAEPEGSVFVAHLDAYGNHLFSGATGAGDFLQGVDVGPKGDLYASGSFQGNINFGSGKLHGDNDGFLAAFQPGGAPDYSFDIHGKSQVFVDDVASAPSGNVIIALRGDDASDVGGGAEKAPQGARQLILASHDHAGQFQWEVRIAANVGNPLTIATDPQGNVLLAAAAYNPVTVGDLSIDYGTFLAKFSPQGKVLWVATMSDPNGYIPYVHDIAADAAGNVYFAGITYGTFDVNGVTVDASNNQSGYLVKLDAQGNGVFGKVFPTTNYVQNVELGVAANGETVVAASTNGLIDMGQGYMGNDYGADVVLGRYSEKGDTLATRVLDGAGHEYASDLALDPTGKPLLCGRFDSTLDVDGTHLVAESGDDLFVARLDF